MIVTIIADVLGNENNGTTTACMNLVRYLRQNNDTVRIVCCDKDKFGLKNYYIVPTYNLGILNKIVEKNEVSLAKADKNILSSALDGADVCHVMIPFSLGRAALKICKEKNIPVTAGFHCQAENFTSHIMLMNSHLVNHLTYKNFYKHFYKHVDAIHYPTEFIKDLFEKEIKAKTNSYVISNGVNDIFKPNKSNKPKELEDKFLILFIGRYSKEKSHKVLIKAVSQSKYKDKIQLIFAGSGPRRNEINKLVKKEKIIQPIMQFYSRENLVKTINYCDLYCHPAEIEIEAIACLEAITCGLVPVISNSSRCATKNFALSDKNLFKFNDYKDLADKIDYWIEHPEEKEKCSEKYLGYTKQFAQNECMYKTREMLVDVVRKNNEK